MESMWRLGGLRWRDLVRLVYDGFAAYEIFDRSAQMAYYFLFSIFPLLLFLTTLLGYLADSAALRQYLIEHMAGLMPALEVNELVSTTLDQIRQGRGTGQLSASLVVAVWAASRGMTAVILSLNAATGVDHPRRWWHRRLVAMALTLLFAGLSLIGLVLVFYGQALGLHALEALHLDRVVLPIWELLRWLAIVIVVSLSFDLVYNFAPAQRSCPRRWGTPGAVVAVTLWLVASLGLQQYVSHFGSFSTTYGSLGAVILLLVWFYLMGTALLVGGLMNAEICNAEDHVRGTTKERA